MLDLKKIQIRIRKDVKIRIQIRYYLKVRSGSGSVIDWKVGSGSEINNFGFATLLFLFKKMYVTILLPL